MNHGLWTTRTQAPPDPRRPHRIGMAVHDTSDHRYEPDHGDRVTDNVKKFRDRFRSHKLAAHTIPNRKP
jgi:hypothetical protein